MSEKKEVKKQDDSESPSIKPKTCFIIMPISDQDGYELGHFGRVYTHIIKPACIKAGFFPIRADEVSGTNMIVIDILQKIITSDMAVCDLSARNPNVFYELGIRQSFDLPVTLIKDDSTPRVFDIQGFRDVSYNQSLRFDLVTDAVERLAISIKETYEYKEKKGDHKGREINSIIDLLGITKATIKEPVQITHDTEVLLNALNEISVRLPISTPQPEPIRTSIRLRKPVLFGAPASNQSARESATLEDGNTVVVGDQVISGEFGNGRVLSIEIKEGIKFLNVLFYALGNPTYMAASAPGLTYHPDNLPF